MSSGPLDNPVTDQERAEFIALLLRGVPPEDPDRCRRCGEPAIAHGELDHEPVIAGWIQ